MNKIEYESGEKTRVRIGMTYGFLSLAASVYAMFALSPLIAQILLIVSITFTMHNLISNEVILNNDKNNTLRNYIPIYNKNNIYRFLTIFFAGVALACNAFFYSINFALLTSPIFIATACITAITISIALMAKIVYRTQPKQNQGTKTLRTNKAEQNQGIKSIRTNFLVGTLRAKFLIFKRYRLQNKTVTNEKEKKQEKDSLAKMNILDALNLYLFGDFKESSVTTKFFGIILFLPKVLMIFPIGLKKLLDIFCTRGAKTKAADAISIGTGLADLKEYSIPEKMMFFITYPIRAALEIVLSIFNVLCAAIIHINKNPKISLVAFCFIGLAGSVFCITHLAHANFMTSIPVIDLNITAIAIAAGSCILLGWFLAYDVYKKDSAKKPDQQQGKEHKSSEVDSGNEGRLNLKSDHSNKSKIDIQKYKSEITLGGSGG